MNEDDVIELEIARDGAAGTRKRQDAAVLQPHVDPIAAFTAALVDHDRHRPVHVVERQPRLGERLQPRLLLLGGFRIGLDALDGIGQIGFGPLEGDAAAIDLEPGEALLQGGFGRALQVRQDGGVDRVGIGGESIDPGDRLGFMREVVDEMKADVAPRICVGDEGRGRIGGRLDARQR